MAEKTITNDRTGLSTCLNLTADLIVRSDQNGECQAFIQESFGTKKTKTGNQGGQRGERIQTGLTGRGKRTIRVVSDCYGQLVSVENDVFGTYDTYCRFITLTFRNIYPDDKTSKRLLDNFLKRLRRRIGRNIHYLWVAERQKRGVIHFHILTPERIVSKQDTDKTGLSMRVVENVWLNRAWNEVVCNYAYKAKKVTKVERDLWRSEYENSERYYVSLMKYKSGQRSTSPRKPVKSKYLLLPNCIHVLNIGHYMAKYISKEGQKIVGGLYNASKLSRQFLVRKQRVRKDFGTVGEGNKVVRYLFHRAKKSGIPIKMFSMPHNDALGIWCKDTWRVMEWYFDYNSYRKIRETRIANKAANEKIGKLGQLIKDNGKQTASKRLESGCNEDKTRITNLID